MDINICFLQAKKILRYVQTPFCLGLIFRKDKESLHNVWLLRSDDAYQQGYYCF